MALRKGTTTPAVETQSDVVADTGPTPEQIQAQADAKAKAKAAAKAKAKAEMEAALAALDDADDQPETEAEAEVEVEAEAEVEEDDSNDPPFESKPVEEEAAPAPAAAMPAVSQPAQPPAQSSSGASGVLNALAEAGFEGLTDGFGTFPMISLKNEGVFESSEGWDMGTEFNCIILNSRKKFVIKNTRCEKRDEETAFSYDTIVDSNTGRPIAELVAEWAEKGWGHDIKTYLECSALLQGGDHDMEPVLLSIPPASKGRLSALQIRESMKTKALPKDYTTRCFVGPKVTKVDFPFYPWNFERVW